MRRYVTCPNIGCGHRNDRAGGRRKCASCGTALPKRRTRKHREVLRGDTYPLFVTAAREIRGVTDESCCVCGKPRSQERRHDRDHDHRTGKARGLACPGNTGCNVLMLPWVDSATAYAIASAKLQAGDPSAARW